MTISWRTLPSGATAGSGAQTFSSFEARSGNKSTPFSSRAAVGGRESEGVQLAGFIGCDASAGRMIHHPQLGLVGVLGLFHLVRQRDTVQATLRSQVAEFRGVVAFHAARDGPAIHLAVEHVLTSVPRVNKRAAQFWRVRHHHDSRDCDDASGYAHHQPGRPAR